MIKEFSDWLAFQVFDMVPGSHLAESVHFFISDMIKIVLLLLIVTHLMSLLRYFLPMKKIKEFLHKKKLFGLDYFFATVFGAITPFCSCSSIPLFIGFLRAEIRLGVTLAFLTTSPLINEVALVLFWSMFGWKVMLVYLLGGMAVGMVSGWFLGKMNLEDQVMDFLSKPTCGCKKKKVPEVKTRVQILKKLSREAFGITKKIIPYLIIGVGLGAAIHGYVPEGYFESVLYQNTWWTVPAAVVLAVPLYANASSVIPIIESLVAKGVPIGTSLAFMMAVVGLSLPEALILKRVMKIKLLLLFFGVVTLGIILLGYGFNFIF